MVMQSGITKQFEGFGVSHPDPLNPDAKRSTHSYKIERDPADGHTRLMYKQFMSSAGEWKPSTEAEGPLTGILIIVMH